MIKFNDTIKVAVRAMAVTTIVIVLLQFAGVVAKW